MNDAVYTYFVGIDIAADTFSMAWRTADATCKKAFGVVKHQTSFDPNYENLKTVA